MSLSGAHRAAFHREASQEGRVFSIRDKGGFPAPRDKDGNRALPFWSKSSRAERVVGQVTAFSGFTVVEIGLDEWLGRWLPDLERDRYLVGINWAGGKATGYDLPVPDVDAWFRTEQP
jgi:hypothetical protein